ncbi:MAG: polymer-forming cytoskeletal protein [Hyphomicrobiaceae bacterium]|nr:polymer-forming cytoskeletal protein [Hyphomicrobiaceae bacterium]
MLFGKKSEDRSETAAEAARAQAPGPSGRLEPPPALERKTRSDAHIGGIANDTRSQSFIDASLTITGDLHSDGDVQLDGRVCGNVSCAQLIVGPDAAITGSITAEQAIIRGSVTGTIRAPAVILQETARVESEITYTMLAVDDGATFEGAAHHSDMPLAEAQNPSSLADLESLIHTTGNAGTPNGRADEAPALPPPAMPQGPSGV